MKPENLLEAMTDIDSGAIEEARQSQPRRSLRRIAAILVAAAVLMAVTACAAANGADWFKLFFAEQSGTILSDSQNAYIDKNAKDNTQSITRDGYTVAVESAISDGKTGYIKMKLTAPEGTVLDADYYGLSSNQIPVNEAGESYAGSGGWDILDDSDKTDNIIHLLYTIDLCAGSWDMGSLTEGHTWTLVFNALTAGYWENRGTEDAHVRTVELARGIWCFDIVFSESGDEEIELVTEPVTIPTHFCLVYGEYIDAQITSLKLRAMSAVMTFVYVDGEVRNDWFDDFYVVMKDGSQVLMDLASGWPGKTTYALDAPIVLEEVDYVLLPGGGKLMMP